MSRNATIDELLADLNPQQRKAATHGDRALLMVSRRPFVAGLP
jgi:hypothetical protein